MKPTLGRIVHYLEGEHVFAGIVVHVDSDHSTVNLVFWNSFGTQMFRHGVAHSTKIAAENKRWFWPPMPQPTIDEVRKAVEKYSAPKKCPHSRRSKSLEPGVGITCVDCGEQL